MTSVAETPSPKIPLTPRRVFQAAIALADGRGIGALTMRNLAAALDVEAMSLYHHVANKEAMLDGVVDEVVQEIERELGGFDTDATPATWQSTLRDRILTARRVMLRHRWAPAVIETRKAATPTTLRYMDSLLGIMFSGGFTPDLGHHAMHALGSRALGFSHELFQPDDSGDDESTDLMRELAPRLPNIVTMMTEVAHDDPDSTIGWCDDETEFEFGLDLLLDGLADRLTSVRQT